jgi:serine/threonine protein kinase
MNIGAVLNDKYRIEKYLGSGGMGSVYLCTNLELGNKWAVKHIPAERVSEKAVYEIEILKRLYHISLPRIVDVFSDESGFFIVESNIEGTGLDRLLKRYGCFGIEQVVDWFLELCDIFRYLHGIRPRPIIYRDLKPANIILTQGNRLALVDFGTCKEFHEHQVKDYVLGGTKAYAAPEQLIRDGRTDQRTDIYNLGVTIYQLFYGALPKGRNESGRLSSDKAAAHLDAVIWKCMENRPEDRYQKVEDIQKELREIKSLLVIRKTRRNMLYKLELAAVAVFSAVTYVFAVLGLVKGRYKYIF